MQTNEFPKQSGDLRIFPTILAKTDSTNRVLREMAEAGAPEGTLILAETQTAGRGRLGRRFLSPSGSGIYMSLLLRPALSASDSLLITTAAAASAAEAIERASGKEAKIKWVNDVYLAGKKVCGILTEGAVCSDRPALRYAILGIGMNVYPPEGGFPAEISDIAGAIFENEQATACRKDPRAEIITNFLTAFAAEYPNLQKKNFFSEYARRSMLNGENVTVHRGDTVRDAKVLGINEDFRLHVRYADGSEELLESGEVSARLK